MLASGAYLWGSCGDPVGLMPVPAFALWAAMLCGVHLSQVQPNANQFDSLVAELEQQLQPQLKASQGAST